MTRQAIILGGSRGIGLAIARKFLRHDIDVTLVASSETNLRNGVDALQRYAAEHGLTRARTNYGVCDLGRQDDIDQCCGRLVQTMAAEKKTVDILVNSAGVTYNKLLVSSTPASVKQLLDVNLLGAMLFTRAIARVMIRQKQGAIVSIGSIVGSSGNSGQTAYAASKAGLVGFTRSLAKELASKGITANLIEPGFIETDMTASSLNVAQIESIRQQVPLQRLGTAEEVANVAYFLVSSPFITGQVFTVDGGLSLVF